MQRALKEAFKGVPFEMMSTAGGAAACGVGNRGGGSSGIRRGPSPLSSGGGSGGGAASAEPESIRSVKEALNLPYINLDKWLTLPRKYTRMVSRFELPIDSTELSRKQISQPVYLSLCNLSHSSLTNGARSAPFGTPT